MESVISEFEDINDDIEDSAGILLVVNRDKRLAKATCGVTKLPALALFKNGADHCQVFNGGDDLENVAAAALNWLTDVETMEIDGRIERVNEDMLANVIESEDDVLVFFHGSSDDFDENELEETLEVLEALDDDLATEQEVEFIRYPVYDGAIIRKFGLSMLPSLVYFDSGVPVVYKSGDLKNGAAILGQHHRDRVNFK